MTPPTSKDMADSLITPKFDQALHRSPGARIYSPGQKACANLCIGAFLLLATALGIAETELVPDANEKFAWRAWGAPALACSSIGGYTGRM